MSGSTASRKNKTRIQPTRLEDLPSVLDVEQASDVLRVSVERVRELTKQGQLRRLRYTRQFLYDSREIRRFLRDQTSCSPEAAA